MPTPEQLAALKSIRTATSGQGVDPLDSPDAMGLMNGAAEMVHNAAQPVDPNEPTPQEMVLAAQPAPDEGTRVNPGMTPNQQALAFSEWQKQRQLAKALE